VTESIYDGHVVPVKSAGGECLICNDPVKPGEPVLRVSFELSLLICKKTFSGELHARCALGLGGDLCKKATYLLGR
jgi:hypothetical protein